MAYVASCQGRAPVVVSAAEGLRLRLAVGWRLLREATSAEEAALGERSSVLLSEIERAQASEGVGMSSPTIVVRDDDSPVLEQRGRRRAR
jgi:hypothetical protein